MTTKTSIRFAGFVIAILAGAGAIARGGLASRYNAASVDADDNSVTILVTADPRNKKDRDLAAALKAEDLAVKENGRPQKVLSVEAASEVPPTVEVLIEDNLSPRINNELDGIRKFIRELPQGSLVLTGYITQGTLEVRQDFTTDRDQAAQSLRVLTRRGTPDLYGEVIEGLKKFDSQPEGRRIMVLISDGLDLSNQSEEVNPDVSTQIRRAISNAQNRRVAVFTAYVSTTQSLPQTSSPTLAPPNVNFGPVSLVKLSDDTGGEALVGPPGAVSLVAYWYELKEMMGNQWLVTYQSTSSGKGFRQIKVSSETRLRLRHQAGYSVE